MHPLHALSASNTYYQNPVNVCASPGGHDGGGAEEGAGQQHYAGENEEEYGVYCKRYNNTTDKNRLKCMYRL